MRVLQFLGSTTGRWVRVVAGVILIVIGGVLGGWWWLAVLGAVFIAAGAFDFCLLAPLVRKPFQGSKLRASFTR